MLLVVALCTGSATTVTSLRPYPPYRMWSFSYNSTAPVDCFRDGNGHQTCGNKTIPTAVSTVRRPKPTATFTAEWLALKVALAEGHPFG